MVCFKLKIKKMKTFVLTLSLCYSIFISAQQPCNPSVATGSANCAAAATGYAPLHDLGSGISPLTGMMGGLYPGGSNYIPLAHKTAGLNLASQIQPLNNTGNPDLVNGKIVLLQIGLSNTNIEGCEFDSIAYQDACKNPQVVLVNGAMGGASAGVISDQTNAGYANYWNNVNGMMAANVVNANQVQAIWFKETNPVWYTPWPTQVTPQVFYDSLLIQFRRIFLEFVNRYPNLKVCYISPRISARYASAALNPEPYAYWQGWAVKKVIEESITGLLPYTGPGRIAPWLAWAPYMWSDGSIPQTASPNFFLNCPADFALDGTHPSLGGAVKVGQLLIDHFKTDSTCYTWFVIPSCFPTGTIENTLSEELIVSPNPFIQQVTFTFGSNNLPLSGIILNVIGEEVQRFEKIDGNTLSFENEHLVPGIYFYSFKMSSGELISGKVMKN